MYFNYSSRAADNYWDRRAFLQSWWRVSAHDRRWTPPAYNALYGALVRRNGPFLRDHRPAALTVEAVMRRRQTTSFGDVMMPAAMGDSIVAHALVLIDGPKVRAAGALPRSAYLAMMAFANDEETLDYLLQAAQAQALAEGAQRIVAPCELTPPLSAGLLLDHFHLTPPLHTPYNAPYVPELMAGALEPLRYSRLWYFDAAALPLPLPLIDGLDIGPFDVARLAGDLLPLAQAASHADGSLAPPDADEIAFALRLWDVAPLYGRLLLLDGEPLGFYLAQADVGPQLRRLRGGRPLWARPLLAMRRPTRAADGRVLLGALLPHARGHGLARHLLADACALAATQGWRTLVVGPVAEEGAATRWLAHMGAVARQRYALLVHES